MPQKWHARFWRPAGGAISSLSSTLLASLQARGVQLSAGPDGALSVTPRSAVTPELREALRANKEEVLQLLQPQSFDDVRSGVRRLEKQLAVDDEDFDYFALVVHDDTRPATHDLDQRIRERARAQGLHGFHLLVVWS